MGRRRAVKTQTDRALRQGIAVLAWCALFSRLDLSQGMTSRPLGCHGRALEIGDAVVTY